MFALLLIRTAAAVLSVQAWTLLCALSLHGLSQFHVMFSSFSRPLSSMVLVVKDPTCVGRYLSKVRPEDTTWIDAYVKQIIKRIEPRDVMQR